MTPFNAFHLSGAYNTLNTKLISKTLAILTWIHDLGTFEA